MSSPPDQSRREFLYALGAAVVAGAAGFAAGKLLGGGKTKTVTKTIPKTFTTTQTVTSSSARGRLKAGWIYVGPIGDVGWTHAHNEGRLEVEKTLGSIVETHYIENVPETQAEGALEQLIDWGAKIVFATSFGFMPAVKNVAKKHPDVWFWHCSGPYEEFLSLPNVGTYFAELYQAYYLSGFLGGAVSQTGRFGYVPAFLTPEVRRHLNAYALGARDGYRLMHGKDKDVKVYVAPELKAWYAPDKARIAAKSLVDNYNVDVLAFTEDSYTVLKVAEEYQEKGKKVWSFSHYSDMSRFGPKADLTGQLVDWGVIYEYILAKLFAGIAEKEDIWARFGDFVPIRWRRPVSQSTMGTKEGAAYMGRVNTSVIPPQALSKAKELYEKMKELLFEPFSGYDPITGEPRELYDNKGNKIVGKCERLGRNELWSTNWLLDNAEQVSS